MTARDWLSEARDLAAHPESQPTAKYALEVCMGLLELIEQEKERANNGRKN